MAVPRFLLSPQALDANPVFLTGADARHANILRLKIGEAVKLGDGQGREYGGRVRRHVGDRWEIERLDEIHNPTEPAVQVTLYAGLARGAKLDWIIQKNTELGMHRLVPLMSSRSQVKISPEDSRHKQARWQEIARQAARQSERIWIPEISLPLSFQLALEEVQKAEAALIFYEGAEPVQDWKTQIRSLQRPRTVSLLVGPEGGFSEEEIQQAVHAGIRPVGLGPRILRSETAAVMAVALALYVWGDLGGLSS